MPDSLLMLCYEREVHITTKLSQTGLTPAGLSLAGHEAVEVTKRL